MLCRFSITWIFEAFDSNIFSSFYLKAFQHLRVKGIHEKVSLSIVIKLKWVKLVQWGSAKSNFLFTAGRKMKAFQRDNKYLFLYQLYEMICVKKTHEFYFRRFVSPFASLRWFLRGFACERKLKWSVFMDEKVKYCSSDFSQSFPQEMRFFLANPFRNLCCDDDEKPIRLKPAFIEAETLLITSQLFMLLKKV